MAGKLVVKRFDKKTLTRNVRKKYGVAVPSREHVLDYLKQSETPVTFTHCVRRLALTPVKKKKFLIFVSRLC